MASLWVQHPHLIKLALTKTLHSLSFAPLVTEDLSAGVKVIDFGNAIHCVYDELSLYYDDFELQTLLYRAPEVSQKAFFPSNKGFETVTVFRMCSLSGNKIMEQAEERR